MMRWGRRSSEIRQQLCLCVMCWWYSLPPTWRASWHTAQPPLFCGLCNASAAPSKWFLAKRQLVALHTDQDAGHLRGCHMAPPAGLGGVAVPPPNAPNPPPCCCCLQGRRAGSSILQSGARSAAKAAAGSHCSPTALSDGRLALTRSRRRQRGCRRPAKPAGQRFQSRRPAEQPLQRRWTGQTRAGWLPPRSLQGKMRSGWQLVVV